MRLSPFLLVKRLTVLVAKLAAERSVQAGTPHQAESRPRGGRLDRCAKRLLCVAHRVLARSGLDRTGRLARPAPSGAAGLSLAVCLLECRPPLVCDRQAPHAGAAGYTPLRTDSTADAPLADWHSRVNRHAHT